MTKRENSSADEGFHRQFIEYSTKQSAEELKVETLKTIRTLIEYRTILVETLDEEDLTESMRETIQTDIRKINVILTKDKQVHYQGDQIDLAQCTVTHMNGFIREAEQNLTALKKKYIDLFKEKDGMDEDNKTLRH